VIFSYTGLPGSGKTLHAVQQMVKRHSAGLKSYANFHSRGSKWEYIQWSDLHRVESGLVVLDEAHMLFSARNWSKTTQEQLAYFQQHRKLGIDLIWIAQSAARVDVALRELTAFEYQHTRIGKLVKFRVIDPVDTETKKKPIKRGFFWLSEYLTAEYWTEERIGDINGRGAGFGRNSAGIDGPIPNYVRATLGNRVLWCRIEDLDLSRSYDRITPFYKDSYGRITMVEAEDYHMMDARTLVSVALNAVNAFFREDPRPVTRG